ncbi:MAG: DNA-binding protein [[Eubacterium] siraeum]
MKTRAHYEKLFASYPDVVTLPEFQTMLGGIGDSTARKIMRANKVKHFYIKMYLSYTQSLCDRLCIEQKDYAKYSKTLKARV